MEDCQQSAQVLRIPLCSEKSRARQRALKHGQMAAFWRSGFGCWHRDRFRRLNRRWSVRFFHLGREFVATSSDRNNQARTLSLDVEAMKVVHPGLRGEAVVATHINRTPREPRMNLHKNARLTPQGRALLVKRVRTEGWRVRDAAAAAGISQRQAFRWLARHRAGDELALQDRSSAPARCPHRTNPDTLAAIERLRRLRRTGPQIARELDLPRSTVGAVLRRLGLGRLTALEAKPQILRYEREKPGELIHIDIKKLGRIDGVGHRITGDRTGQSNKRGTGWEYLHVAIDDACRLAYSEVLASEKADSAIALTRRALAWFKRFGVSVERIMTDNGSAYKKFRLPGPVGRAGRPP